MHELSGHSVQLYQPWPVCLMHTATGQARERHMDPFVGYILEVGQREKELPST